MMHMFIFRKCCTFPMMQWRCQSSQGLMAWQRSICLLLHFLCVAAGSCGRSTYHIKCRTVGGCHRPHTCIAGLLVWSVALVERQRDVAAAAVFAALLNMKHLFAAAAPVLFVYLLSRSCRWAPFVRLLHPKMIGCFASGCQHLLSLPTIALICMLYIEIDTDHQFSTAVVLTKVATAACKTSLQFSVLVCWRILDRSWLAAGSGSHWRSSAGWQQWCWRCSDCPSAHGCALASCEW